MMLLSLHDIFQLEDAGKYEEAFDAYKKLYAENGLDYNVWKHFYFFLWASIEDTTEDFHEKINLRTLLQTMFDDGRKSFIENADFNFIAGYTACIFPYEYGTYDDLEKEGRAMLKKAAELEPGNVIYRMVYLGSLASGEKYKKAVIAAAPVVLETFRGIGTLNRYFRQVLYYRSFT